MMPLTGTPPAPPADLLAMLEEALALRQEAVLAVERLLAAPHAPAALERARRRVEGLAAASEVLLADFAHAAGVRPAGRPLP